MTSILLNKLPSKKRYLDFMNLMTYDLRGTFDEFASHHSALYSGSYEEGEQKVFNQVSSFQQSKLCGNLILKYQT